MIEQHTGPLGAAHVITAMQRLIDHISNIVFADDVVQYSWDGDLEISRLTITTSVSEHCNITSELRDGENPIDFYGRHRVAVESVSIK